jgi:hypothetical protein
MRELSFQTSYRLSKTAKKVFITFTLNGLCMKAVYIFAMLMAFSPRIVFAEIKNGYEKRITGTIVSIQRLNARLLSDKKLSILERQLIKSEIRELTEIISHYELTQQLINQFRIVSPVMYNELDTIRDKQKRPTNIFVKLIPRDKPIMQLRAATIFIQSSTDADASVSEYGENSVSVNLSIDYNSVLMLSHELGHIKYVVPHLAEYVTFYKKWYKRELSEFNYFGHNRFDESGRYAEAFEERFRGDLASYLINGGTKFESPAILLYRIRRNSRKSELPPHLELSFAWAFARR